MNILILNGPNLNLLGKREPIIYGTSSFEDYLITLKEKYTGVNFTYFQSNIEGELINKIHEYGYSYDGMIFNAGAYAHTSIAIADAISAVTTPCIEVHISNVAGREPYRHTSYLTPVCKGLIMGFGLNVYELAVIALKL